MNIMLAFARDAWGRASLSAALHTDEPSRVMTFAEFGDNIWWAKSPFATTDHTYSVLYHHVDNAEQRQVIVTCGSIIQDCVIPKGFDPSASQEAMIEPLTPSIIYSHGIHRLGIIVLPKTTTRSMRNRIWKLKDDFYSCALMPYADALSHGRTGHLLRHT